jgi:adenylate cyclase class 1
VSAWLEPYVRNAEAFCRHNQRRIEYLRSCLSEKQRDVFDLIPLLLHEDDGQLPGNLESGCPTTGITCFTISPQMRTLAGHYFPDFRLQQKAKNSVPIVFLALMGSAGSVAFTKESDLDFWVGIEADKHDAEFLALLSEKLKAIEAWAARTAGLEVHFFPADLRRIRAEDYGELDKESCGTALGKLLKDEFYRTSIILQGRLPFYWLMPVGLSDADYRDALLRLYTTASFAKENFVDLGNVHRFNQAEYFGAALWQLLKGLRAPFKSVLKMALIDKYTAEGKTAQPLCEEYKQAVLQKQASQHVDPYLFMLESLRGHYTACRRIAERQLIEECFLIRNLLEAEPASGAQRTRGELFRALGAEWGWGPEQLKSFEDFRAWDVAEMELFNKQIINFFLETYKRIRTRTKEARSRISDRDMTVVGKKLQGFFGKREGKVPYEFSLFGPGDIAAIELHAPAAGAADTEWRVKVAMKGANPGRQYQLVRKFSNPLLCCAWCSLNQFLHPRVQLTIRGKTSLVAREALNLSRSLDAFFPDDTPDTLKINDLLDEQYITHVYIIANWELEEWDKKLKSLFLFFRNTLGELAYDSHQGDDCLGWLTNTVMLDKIGRWRLKNLCWQVYNPKEVITPSRRIGESLQKYIREYIDQAV